MFDLIPLFQRYVNSVVILCLTR